MSRRKRLPKDDCYFLLHTLSGMKNNFGPCYGRLLNGFGVTSRISKFARRVNDDVNALQTELLRVVREYGEEE